MLFVTGIIITFFLSIILWSKKGKTAADHVLAAWLCVLGLHLFFYYWFITGQIYKYPQFLGLQIPMPLMHGPLLYMYTHTLARNERFSPKLLLHLLPAAITYPALIKFFQLSGAEKIIVYKNEGAGFEIYSDVINGATIISGFLYVFLSFRELWLYRKRIAEEFSNTERINLNWLRGLIWGILLVWIIVTVSGADELVFGSVVIFILLLGYFGIKHVGIFTYQPQASAPEDVPVKEPPITVQSPLKTRYERSGLQKEAADTIYHNLNRLMTTDRLFKNAELSLAQLAGQLDTHPNNLSQVINTYENKTFYDYINTLRIQEFKEIVALPDNRNYTLLSLAFECGFNSKTSFNRNFKKITGLSPSAYLKEVHVELADA